MKKPKEIIDTEYNAKLKSLEGGVVCTPSNVKYIEYSAYETLEAERDQWKEKADYFEEQCKKLEDELREAWQEYEGI